jgi:prephenate dehydratase
LQREANADEECRTMKVAIQGERGSFSHEAARDFFPGLNENQPDTLVPCAISSEVFALLSSGSVDAAVVPIENSLAGSVLEHYDLLLEHSVCIHSERLLRIRHQLIAAPGVPLGDVREVYSHPVALAQCRRFLAAHPQMRALPFYDTAGSAAHAVRVGGKIAGIASSLAAVEYGGEILSPNIEDNAANYTRFLLLLAAHSPQNAVWGAAEKVSLAFSVPNRAGSLVEALQIFARHRLNMTRLESRPVPGSPWEYVFYADYSIGTGDAADRALAELEQLCGFVKELGRYPAAPTLPSGL